MSIETKYLNGILTKSITDDVKQGFAREIYRRKPSKGIRIRYVLKKLGTKYIIEKLKCVFNNGQYIDTDSATIGELTDSTLTCYHAKQILHNDIQNNQ